MTIDPAPLSERVASYYAQLSLAAKDLNSISDELGKSIAEIDVALKKLNLGVAVWVPIRKEEGTPFESWYWSEDLGYAKSGATWGICLRKVNGDYQRADGDEQLELWLFNDAPRTLRISAIGKIPDLLQKLSQEAVKTTGEIRAKLNEAQEVAAALRGAGTGIEIPTADLKTSAGLPKSRQRAPIASVGGLTLDSLRQAVGSALIVAKHSSAAQLLNSSEWLFDSISLQIVVPGVGKKMLSLVVNPAAEKIIRNELQRLGAPANLMLIPGESTEQSCAQVSDPTEVRNEVPEGEK